MYFAAQNYLNFVFLGPSENQLHHSSGVNPGNLDFQHQLHQPSQFSNFPEHSSHFSAHSENVMNSLEMPYMQSQEVLPSVTHVPGVHSPSHQHFSNDPAMAVHENSFSNVPNSFGNENFNPSGASPSQGFQNSHQPSHEHLQNIHSPHAQGVHPSLYSDDFVDDDYSRTLAMLSSLGFEGSDMYAGQDYRVQPSSQNTERNHDFSANEFEAMSSQSQHSLVESSDPILHSSVDSSLHINENTFQNSDNLEKSRDSVHPENTHSVPPGILNTVQEKQSIKSTINEGNLQEENEELLSEENIDDDLEMETGEDDDEEEENDISSDDESNLNAKNTNDIENELKLHSVSSSQMNLQTSEGIPDLQSSREISNTADKLLKDHSSTIEKKHLEISLSETLSNINTAPQETKFSLDTHSILESSMTESIRKTDSTENFVQNNLNENVDINSNIVNPVVSHTETAQEKIVNIPNTFPEDLSKLDRNNNNDALTTESSIYKKEHTTPKISDFFMENEKRVEVEQIISPLDIDGLGEDLTTYQGRNLKGEYGTTDDPNSDSEGSNDENNTQSDSDSYSSYRNWFDALRSAIDAIMSWVSSVFYFLCTFQFFL